MRALLVAALLVIVGSPALGQGFTSVVLAQGAPGTNLAVEVGFRRIVMRADTVRIEYLVRNAEESREELFEFTVEAPSKVVRIDLPVPEENWDTSTVYKTLSVASWGLLGEQLHAGATTPRLAFEAVGLPGLVTYWAGGWFPVEPLETEYEPPPPMSPREAIAATAVQGRTIGVDPLPADRRPAALLERLGGLLDDTCGDLGWITSPSVCSSLKEKLQQAGRSLGKGDNTGARGRMESFLAELAAQHNAGETLPVKDAAFWLLTVNAEYLRDRILRR
jgi:FIMAH domain-containing protein